MLDLKVISVLVDRNTLLFCFGCTGRRPYWGPEVGDSKDSSGATECADERLSVAKISLDNFDAFLR